MNSKDFLKEGFVEDAHMMHQDHEVQMAREELYHAAEDAIALHRLLRNVSEQQGLEGWVSSKITLAADYLKTVREYLEYELMSQNSSDKVTVVGNVLPIAEDSQDKTVKIVKRRGKPIGEIGIDPEASPGNGPYYVKLYDGSVDLSGYDTVEEAMAELKYLVKQRVAEATRPTLSQMYKVGWNDGVEDEFNEEYRNDPEYNRGFEDGLDHAIGPKGYGRSNPKRYKLDQGVAEGKKSDRYHIVGKDGKPANLASYAGRASAIKDRDEKYPGAVVQQVGPRGKVKDVAEGSVIKKPQPYNDPNWAKKLPKEKLNALAGPRYKKDKKEQGVVEGSEDNPVANAIYRRLMLQKPDLFTRYGLEYVAQAVEDVADFVGDVEEIGSSDVSGWVRQVEQNLKDKINQYDEPMQDIDRLAEMSAGSVATVVNPTPKNKAKVGTLFGGTYKQKKTKA